MKHTKKICILFTAFALMFTTIAYANDKSIFLTEFKLKRGAVAVEVTNNSDAETLLTVVLEKNDESRPYYGFYEKKVKGKEKISLNIPIPDEIKGVAGTGSYVLKVQNSKEERIEQAFNYADSDSIADFLADLKEEAAKVTVADKAYELLMPIANNETILFSIGVDYEKLSNMDISIWNTAMNVLYSNGLDDVSTNTLPAEIMSAFGLAVYNSGEKLEGIDILSPVYNSVDAEDELITGAVNHMAASYENTTAFVEGFGIAYGLETVKRSTVGAMEETLETFVTETGLCSEAFAKLKALSTAQKRTAFEYMILEIDKNGLSSWNILNSLMQAAYEKAIQGGSGGSSGGSGGGAGSVSNSSGTNSGGVSMATGVGSYDEKNAYTKMIFTDLSAEHWSAPAVVWLKNKGIVNGNENGAFEPERSVTREEFTKMLVVACEFSVDNGKTVFADVDSKEWYAPYISSAVDMGIINGISETAFGIGERITRQDMSVMIKRAADARDIKLKTIKEYPGFADKGEISDYASDAIKALFESGIINGKGDNLFDPTGNSTRAEAAKIIYEAFKGGA